MKVEIKKMGDVNARDVILFPLNSDFVSETEVKSGNEVYVLYSNDMIVIAKNMNSVNRLLDRIAVMIVDKADEKHIVLIDKSEVR